MKVLVACDTFKGSVTAEEACEVIANGLWEACPGVEVEQVPVADGGEGFSKLVQKSAGGELVSCTTLDAIGRVCVADYLLLGDTAVIEMAASCGLTKIEPELREPEYANTAGVGIMMRHAIQRHGVRKMVVGIGGSATNDGGAGMAAELGARFLDAEGRELMPVPVELARMEKVDMSGMLNLPEVLVASDVRNPLLGPHGATAVYGPQKGVKDSAAMEAFLETLVRVSEGETAAESEGAGAAGGLGFGLMHFARAQRVSGFDWFAEQMQLKKTIDSVDLVITGEGSLDDQSLDGKAPVGIAKLAREAGTPVVAMVGRSEGDAGALFDRVYVLAHLGLPPDECCAQAKVLLKNLAREEASRWC